MKRQIITAFIAVILLLNKYAGQSAFGDSLVKYEREFFLSANDTEKASAILKKIETYIKHDSINVELAREIKRVNISQIKDQRIKNNFLWNASIIYHLNNDYNNAKNYISQYFKYSNDSSNNAVLMAIMINYQYEPEQTKKLINRYKVIDSLFSFEECLINIGWRAQVKAKKFFVTASYIIPGLGTIMLGKPIRGLTSLATVGALAAGTYILAHSGLYLNALFISFPWLYKIYFGQTRLTEKIIEEKELARRIKLSNECERAINLILQKYPIEFK